MMSFIESARRAGRHRQNGCTIAAGHASEFFSRPTVTSPYDAVQTVAAFGSVDVSVREDRDRVRRIVERRIEVREVVRLRVDRLAKLVTHAELETQLAIHFPTIRDESLSLRETEKTHRIESLFAVSSEVSQKRIGKGVV